VGDEDLRALLEAARWAPSSWGEEPWRFLVARRGDPHRSTLEATLSEGNAYARRASVLIASLAKTHFTRNGRVNRFASHDTGLATAALILEATHRGLITHPMGGFDAEALRKNFEIPEGFEPMAMVAVGWHDPALADEALVLKEERTRRRKPLEDIAFGSAFGTPVRWEEKETASRRPRGRPEHR
jgi:nitroreductase